MNGCLLNIRAAAVLGGALFATSAASAQAEDWRYLAKDGPVAVAVDVDSFGGPGTRRTVRSALVPMEAGDAYGWLVVDAVIDCGSRTISGVRISLHDEQGGLSEQLDVPPESNAVKQADGTEALANASCDGVELTGRAFTSVGAFAAWVKDGGAGQ